MQNYLNVDIQSSFVRNIAAGQAKGQIKPKADLRAVDSPKKWTDEFGFFAVKSKKSTVQEATREDNT